jgi:hypothetical protein
MYLFLLRELRRRRLRLRLLRLLALCRLSRRRHFCRRRLSRRCPLLEVHRRLRRRRRRLRRRRRFVSVPLLVGFSLNVGQALSNPQRNGIIHFLL